LADPIAIEPPVVPRVMRAARHSGYGAAHDVLELVYDHPVPQVGNDQLLIHNRATSVNPIDSAVRSGYGAAYWEAIGQVALPHIPGRDVAGTVVAAGRNVTRFAVGDEIWAGTFSGGSADYVAISESWAARRPRAWSDLEAGSLPYVALTVWAALVRQVGLTPQNTAGKKIIIPRGAGGVGSFAIQLMKAWGAHVATIVSTGNIEFVKSLGADVVIDRTCEDFSEVLVDYDVALDTSFGIEQKLLGALKSNADAAYVAILTPKLRLIDRHGLDKGQELGEEFFLEKVAAQRAFGRSYYWSFMKPDGEALAEITQLADAGKIKPVIDRIYPLDKLADAHDFSDSKQVRGKIVIDLGAAASG
jgi:reticulon-4-interacting protein 1, mitochondrial